MNKPKLHCDGKTTHSVRITSKAYDALLRMALERDTHNISVVACEAIERHEINLMYGREIEHLINAGGVGAVIPRETDDEI